MNPAANDAPLNILFVSHDAYPHGAQYLLLNLVGWLKQNGFVNPRFVLAGPGSLVDEFLRVGPALRLDAIWQDGAASERALRLLRSFSGDNLSAVYLNSAAAGHVIELTRHLNVPQIAHVHELEKSIERWVGAKKMAALQAYADLFIAASGPVADNLHERHQIPGQKLRVVDAFIKCTGIRSLSKAEKRSCKSALGLSPETKVVLGCGTTDWRKGPDLFVEVAQAVRENYGSPVQFVWVGSETAEGERRELEQMTNAGGLGEQVKFIGEVSNPLPYMLAADVFLLPSREDPFPLVCLEAADCGIPVICFAEAGGMPDFVGATGGAVVPYLDIREMADTLSSFLRDEAKALRLGEQAREKVRSQFDVSVKGQDIYKILKDVCSAEESGLALSDFKAVGG
ncbi:MAG: glycosyltransferase family 4 protein [Pyrinomonadaceae bacterium]